MQFVRASLLRGFGVALTCTAAVAVFVGVTGIGRGEAGEPAGVDKPLIAHWAFGELFGSTCVDSSDNGHDASPERGQLAERTQGLFGTALTLSGNHVLRVSGKPLFGAMPEIALSAWVLPTGFERYTEIFRKEDGDSRVLFAFQENGTLLSLGLNVNGYVECDAPIEPALVLDGNWHHCAATFDGKFMRVYLDGKEVGSLERPGAIVAGGAALACIGSSNGGECFQGALDELRIYAKALTADEVGRLYQAGVAALAALSEDVAGGEPSLGKPLLAHWEFNEKGGATLHEATGKQALSVESERLIPRTRGVHGNALDLHGENVLQAAGVVPTELSKVSLAVWARPADLSGFRELFRQECPNRLLFSFQEGGRILSFGLNAGGYEECDAEITPAVSDGAWHHCAATFDGEVMRVYLDGQQIGSLERTGKLTVQTDAPAFIGSSSGTGEFYQGSLDDLRVYADALTPDEVTLLYRSGVESQERLAKGLEGTLSAFYAPQQSFAETLASCRKNRIEKRVPLDRDLAGLLLTKLNAAFPEDYANFTNWTGANPLEYLTARDDAIEVAAAERMVGLLLEYKPLTEHQRQKQTPEELRKWEAADKLQQQLDRLKASGETARFSPEWIQLVLAAGPQIQFRPYVSEAVAPYLKPETPMTRSLTAAEAEEVLQRDWLHQAGGNPIPARIRSELGWARELADRISSQSPAAVDFAPELAELKTLEEQAATTTTADPALYFRVREVKRRIMFRNPAVDFTKVLFVDMPFPAGSEWPHETRHRLGYMAVPGARLLALDGLGPGGKLTQLMPEAPLHGSFWRPDVSYDGQRVLFCFKPHNEKSFHLYEINVDGSGLTQLTDGPYDDFDPIYLPDDKHLLFSTTRAHTYVRCMPPTNAFVLARCDRDGKHVYLISANNEPDYLPSVMNDGRVIYTRWEYTDKPLWRDQSLWTINPDGTYVSTFWGNQSVWPDLLKDARSIPGSRRVMFAGSAHHNWFSGSVGIIDPQGGFNFPEGLTKVTADVGWPESGNGPVDPIESPKYHASGAYQAYYSPYPLSEHDFLVSANRGGKFVLYLMDTEGNRELIYEGVNNLFHAIPLKPRPKPPLLSDHVAWPTRAERLHPKDGVIFSGDVYQGAPPELKGKAKYLRVLNIDPKTYTYWYKRPYLSTGPVVSALQSEGVKRILGTVPIEKDGSVAFHAPPGLSLHFQLLDENQRALQTMRSFVSVMPGETRGCLGCHEPHSRAPENPQPGLALSKAPQQITPPPWGDETISYPRFVQPTLDKYCGKCHQGNGEARKVLDLTERPSSPIFTEPYLTLIGRPSWGSPYQKPDTPPPGFGIADTLLVEAYSTTDPAAYTTPQPMTALSYKSRLIDLASSGKHHNVKIDPLSLLKLIAWVDTMCPYRGEEEVREIPDPEFQGVDWLAVRPKIQNAPRIVRPGPVD